MKHDRGAEAPAATIPQFDEAQRRLAIEQLRAEQNLPLGALAGVIGALAGAGIWAGITVATGVQIGWMAVGVGFLVGIAVRTFGKGLDTVFGAVGAVLALLGCAVGNLLSICARIAAERSSGLAEVLSELDLEIAKELMIASFTPIDLVFYGVAVYEAYRFSFRQLTEQEIASRITGQRIG